MRIIIWVKASQKFLTRHYSYLEDLLNKNGFSYIRKSISQVYKPTIGADFHSKKLEIMEGDEMKSVTL